MQGLPPRGSGQVQVFLCAHGLAMFWDRGHQESGDSLLR